VEALITALAFSPDGRRVASGQIDGVVHVWDVDDGRELPANITHQGAVSGLAFLEDGRTLLSASRPGEIKVSNVETIRSGNEALPRMAAPVLSAAMHRKQPWLVTGLADLPTRRFGFQFLEATGSGRLLCFARVSDSFSCLALARDGRWLAAGGTDGAARLYDLAPVEEAIGARRNEIHLQPLPLGGGGIRPPHRKPVKSISMLADGRGYLTTALDNHIVLWDAETRKPALQVQGEPDESFAGAELLGDGRLVSALSDGRLRLWEAT
jgi:WD40 repeat protein